MRTPKRNDIFLVDYGKNIIGSEQGGIRPSVVVQNDTGNFFSDTVIVMPMTTKIKNINQPTHTLIMKGKDNGLAENSMVLGECIRQISKERIIKYIGSITSDKDKSEIRRVYYANFGE